MQNQQQPKLFAFKLAQKRQEDAKPAQQWQTRDGVSVAGCSGPDARGPSTWGGADTGIYC